MKLSKLVTYLGIILSFVFIFVTFFHPAEFGLDLGRHILFGQLMVEKKFIILTNIISYTATNFRYVNSHWLSEVVLFLIYNNFKTTGLIIFVTLISIISFINIFYVAIKKYPLVNILFASTLYLNFLTARNGIRPEAFSYFFMSIFILILYVNKTKPTRLIYLLIPLQILWVNFHINFIIGSLLVFIFLIDMFFSEKRKLNRRVLILGGVFIASLISTLINPNFIHGALFPLNFMSNYSFIIQENINVFSLSFIYNFRDFILLELICAFLFILLFCYRKKADVLDFLLIIIFAFGALFATRNIALFAFATFIVFTKFITFLFYDVIKIIKKNLRKTIYLRLKIFFLIMLCISLVGTSFNEIAMQGFGIGETAMGKEAVDYLIKNHIKGPIYNNFESGQYLAYRLYPKERVFVDGRPEAYPKEFFEKIYNPINKNPQFFTTVEKKYNFNAIFLFHFYTSGAELTYFMNKSDYKTVYLDNKSVILVKNTKENELILKNTINQNNFVLPDTSDKNILFEYLLFFSKVKWDNQKMKTYLTLHSLDKSDCYLKSFINQYEEIASTINIKLSNNFCPR